MTLVILFRLVSSGITALSYNLNGRQKKLSNDKVYFGGNWQKMFYDKIKSSKFRPFKLNEFSKEVIDFFIY